MNVGELGQRFLDRETISGVAYLHNDPVRVISGPHSGNVGSLVTLLSLSPEPCFVVELESGIDVEVMQSEIVHVLA
jgi:hypothetical protein